MLLPPRINCGVYQFLHLWGWMHNQDRQSTTEQCSDRKHLKWGKKYKYGLFLREISSDYSLKADSKYNSQIVAVVFFHFLSFTFKCAFFFPFYHHKLCLPVRWAQVGWVDVVRVARTHTEQVSPTRGYGMRQLSIHFQPSALNGW